ncbi:MAG: hypothetical protein WBW76_08950, partial [Candidatus Cybelea sp.]
MKISSRAKCVLAIATGAALLVACSNNGGSSLEPAGASPGVAAIGHIGRAVMWNGVLITAAHPNLSAHQPVRPHPTKSMESGFFQYIGDFGSGTILEFDYPKGDASIGSFGFGALGECTRNG